MICKWWGHDLNEEAAYYYNVYDCRRCGLVYDDDRGAREWIKIGWWRASEWVRGRWYSLRFWWRCDECGGRLGRHDYERFDHLPF